MTPSSPEFADLLERAKAGEAPAVDRLILLLEQQLRSSVAVRLGPTLRAKVRESDVLQNVYVEMLRSLPKLQATTEAGFVAWVTQLIESDILRQHRWFKAAKRAAPESSTGLNVLARVLLPDPETPSAAVSQREAQAMLHEAIDSLSEDHARVCRLVLVEGLSHKDAAERMGRSEAATRMLLVRARAELSLALRRRDRDV